MKLFEVTTTKEETRELLRRFVLQDTAVNFFARMVPALYHHFPEAIYRGPMFRAINFDTEDGPPNLSKIHPYTSSGRLPHDQGIYQSWSKSIDGIEHVAEHNFLTDEKAYEGRVDFYETEAVAIFKQVAEGIDVNAIIGTNHKYAGEEEIIAEVANPKLFSFWYNGEMYPPDFDDLRDEIKWMWGEDS